MPTARASLAAALLMSWLALSGCSGVEAVPDGMTTTSVAAPNGAVGTDPTAGTDAAGQPVKVAHAIDPKKTTEAAAAPAVDPTNYAGKWQITDGKTGRICAMSLDKKETEGTYRASSSGCKTSELSRVAGWQMSGSELILLKTGGDTIAQLRASSSNRMDGALDPDGSVLTMWR